MQLGLGTVQFGLDYGISNHGGKTGPDEVRRILDLAEANGIRALDTASHYGSSEEILGNCLNGSNRFRIITKTQPFKKRLIDTGDADDLEKTLLLSLSKLRQKSVSGVLVWNSADLFVPGGEQLYRRLLQLRDDGVTEKIGASVYSGAEIDQLLANFDLDLVQLPMNLLDQRLLKSNHLSKLKERNIEIHVRSVFLQGLLLTNPSQIHRYFSPIRPVLDEYWRLLDQFGFSAAEAALGFIGQQKEVDVVLVGVNNSQQLKTNLESFRKSLDCRLDFSRFAVEQEDMVNPALWRIK